MSYLDEKKQQATQNEENLGSYSQDRSQENYTTHNGQLMRRETSFTGRDKWVQADDQDRLEHSRRNTTNALQDSADRLRGMGQDIQGRAPIQAGQVSLGPTQTVGANSYQRPRDVAAPQNLPVAQMQAAQLGAVPQAQAQNAQGTSFQAAQVGAINPAQAASVDQNFANQMRGQQLALANSLQQQAGGNNPLAQEMLKSAMDRNQAMAASQAASARGRVNPGQIARQMSDQTVTANQGAQREAFLAGLQNQAQTQQQLGNLISGTRGQDLSVAGQNAGFQQGANLATHGADVQAALANASMAQQANQFGAQTDFQAGMQNAAMGSQMAAGNRDAALQAAIAQGGFDQGANQFNAGAANNMTQFGAGLDMTAQQANQGADLAMGQLDANVGMFNAGQANHMNLAGAQLGVNQNQFNAGLGVQQQQHADRMGMGLEQAAMNHQLTGHGIWEGANQFNAGVDQNLYRGGLDQMGMEFDYLARQAAINEQRRQFDYNNSHHGYMRDLGRSMFRGGAEGAMTAILASDERVKTNIEPGSEKIGEMLDALQSASYDYREPHKPFRSPGRKYGVMAQDLERSEAGKTFVVDTPDGKVVKYGEMLPALLAATADIHRRVKKVEGE